VVRLRVARERARPPRDGSDRHVSKRTNQELLERLEAENAQLRAGVVDLMLEIRAFARWCQTALAATSMFLMGPAAVAMYSATARPSASTGKPGVTWRGFGNGSGRFRDANLNPYDHLCEAGRA